MPEFFKLWGCTIKSIIICKHCTCVLGLNTGILLLTNIFNIYLLWEPFPNRIAELLAQNSHANTLVYCLLFTLPSPFMLPMMLNMGGIFNGPNFQKN